MISRDQIKLKRRWVVKVGSALLTKNGTTLDHQAIARLADQIKRLRSEQVDVVLVSSGSVAAGVSQLKMDKRPERINELQAAAAVGQAALIQSYENAFEKDAITVGQVLLTHSDIADRERYLNARATLSTLLDLGVLVIVNENDTVATEEICFGDNDNLAALVANLIEADVLVILTDQDGLFTADPRKHQSATLVSSVDAMDESLLSMASGGSALGRGGMITKLTAAQKASRSGASTVIANGNLDGVLEKIYRGDEVGTLLQAHSRLASKKQWMAGQMRSRGSVTLDAGAVRTLLKKGSSLLPVGVTAVAGQFERGSIITCVDQSGNELARGLSNYSSTDATKLMGRRSDEISELLGYRGDDELIHRDNLVLI